MPHEHRRFIADFREGGLLAPVRLPRPLSSLKSRVREFASHSSIAYRRRLNGATLLFNV